MNSKQKTINGSSDLLTLKADAYAHAVYAISKKLPREEMFGLTSQLKRAALSVPLNVVEGFARQSAKSESQFLKIAYGSLKESQYILRFAVSEGLVQEKDIDLAFTLGDDAGKLLWKKTQALVHKQGSVR